MCYVFEVTTSFSRQWVYVLHGEKTFVSRRHRAAMQLMLSQTLADNI